MAKAKTTKASVLITDPETPPATQAASLAIALCKIAKVDDWDAFEAAVELADAELLGLLGSIHLSPEQVQLINDHPLAVRYVGAKAPLRTVAVCDTCTQLLVVSGAGSPKRCSLTRDCKGTLHRASAATRREKTGS